VLVRQVWALGVIGAAVSLLSMAPVIGTPSQEPARPPDIFYAPTREAVVYEMLELADINRNDVVYDLGSGDGRIVVLAAQKYGVKGVGIEIDPKLVRVSRQVARDVGLDDRVTFVEGDLFKADIGPATIVTLYLSNSINRDLEPKLRRELRPGTRIVSHQFPIGRWTPTRTIRSAEDGTPLHLWVVPPVDGKQDVR
jgi:SAM-dependent methyltransferase